MRVKLEPETAFIGKKFAYIFFGVIFGFNVFAFIWFFFFFKFNIDLKFSSNIYIQLILFFNKTKIKVFLENLILFTFNY